MNITYMHRTKKDWCLVIIRHRNRRYAWFGRTFTNVVKRAQRFVDGAA